jgi:hypothetical protein
VKNKIAGSLIPVALGVAAAFGVAQAPAAHASTLITARVAGGTLIQTSAHLHVGEVLHVGLNGEAITVVSEENLGGSTLAWVSPGFPPGWTGRGVVLSTS